MSVAAFADRELVAVRICGIKYGVRLHNNFAVRGVCIVRDKHAVPHGHSAVRQRQRGLARAVIVCAKARGNVERSPNEVFAAIDRKLPGLACADGQAVRNRQTRAFFGILGKRPFDAAFVGVLNPQALRDRSRVREGDVAAVCRKIPELAAAEHVVGVPPVYPVVPVVEIAVSPLSFPIGIC